MIFGKNNSQSQLILLFVFLILGNKLSWAESGKIPENSGLPTPPYKSMSKPLTHIETMELHQRRFINAANNTAKLFSQFDQKVHEVTLAAKAATTYPYDERFQYQLLNKTRQMERAQKNFNSRYLQLQSQMEYEFRRFIAASNDFIEQECRISN